MPSVPRAVHPDLCDVRVAYENFTLVGSRLYRKLKNGFTQRVSSRLGGNLVAEAEGARYLASEVAWALHYGNWPTCPIHFVNGDNENMSVENMLPLRYGIRPRCRITGDNHGGFKHPLMPRMRFASEAYAKADWLTCIAGKLREDLPDILRRESILRESHRLHHGDPTYRPWVPAEKRPKRAKRPGQPKVIPPKRPADLPGRKWHWFEQAWLSVPIACHMSDDYKVRCHAVKYLGALKFYYDPIAQRTKFLTAMQIHALQGRMAEAHPSLAAMSHVPEFGSEQAAA